MKIGFFISKYPYLGTPPRARYFVGGSVAAAHEVCNALVARSHDVDVFTSAYASADELERYDNLTVHRYGSQLSIGTVNVSAGICIKPRRIPVDVAVVNFDEPPTPIAGYIYARKTGIPYIVYYHGDWDASYGSVMRRLGVAASIRYVDALLRHADAIVSVSQHYADQSPFLKAYRDKITIVPNGIHADSFTRAPTERACRAHLSIPSDAPLALFLSNLYANKAPDELVQAFAHVLGSEPTAFLVIAGDGPLRAPLERSASRLGIRNHLRFVGAVPAAERTRYYSAADVFVLPSHKEALSTVVLESLLCRTPIIITDGNGCVDIVREAHCGYIARRGDVRGLGAVITYALQHHEESRAMGERGNRYVRQHLTWDNFVQRLEDLIARVLHRREVRTEDPARLLPPRNMKI
jgi:glycosyltransferase involved in cell wall biosynthesis